MPLRFKYLSGDFPEGTTLVSTSKVLSLILPRQNVFGRQELIKLDRNVRSVELIGDDAQQDWIEKFKRGASQVLQQSESPSARALMNALVAGSTEAATTLLSQEKSEVCFACRLIDGRQFLAFADAKIYRALVAEAAHLRAIEQWQNRDFVEAVMAACALMSVSDGCVRTVEQEKLCRLIVAHVTFSAFDPAALQSKFLSYCRAIADDAVAGRAWATEAVQKLRGKDEQARALMQIAMEIGEADQPLSPAERSAVKEICSNLGLYPGEFGCFYTEAEREETRLANQLAKSRIARRRRQDAFE